MSAETSLPFFSEPTRRWFQSNFQGPTAVQLGAWPHIARGDHTLLLAPTGSGKTLAAFLACLDRLSQVPTDAEPGVRVLYISPLKALAYDIERNLRAPLIGIQRAAAGLGHTLRPMAVDLRTGDTPQRERARQKRKPNDILVTTPESLYLLLTSQARENLRHVQAVILDEIHVMAGTKRGVHLALSLERLAELCEHEPQRVGLSATQHPLEEAARFLGGDREVAIVDTTAPPRLELQIVVPVADMENPDLSAAELGVPSADLTEPDDDIDPFDLDLEAAGWDDEAGAFRQTPGTGVQQSGIWPTIHPRLLELIRSHRSTIVFVNSRVLCERLAAALNELAGEELVRAHHGSLSHDKRADIEEALKGGQVPALVATSSLELGVDMGAVDLVILVESPGSAARGLQRIGRAGHSVGAVSHGRIFPKFKGDLLESAVVAQHMARGTIEATRVPRNCLDVLAQQIVAMVVERDWTVEELEALVQRAYPYAQLGREVLTSVLDMLSGRYPDDAFSSLSPAVVWDRATNTLSARKGAQKLAILNGGTIPDRGLYRVHLGEKGPRLGELDEEMVYECREGDCIILGASTWRIDEITRDRVNVSPAPGQPGRLPFWRGERPGRPIELGRALGAFLRRLQDLDTEACREAILTETPLDELAANNLVDYLMEQREQTGLLPTDTNIVVEKFRDELGDWRVCLLTPFGSRVHAPWALALEARLSAALGETITAFYSDDGIAIRFPDADSLPVLDALLIDAEELEPLLIDQLRHSALFATRFRENAGRALLLPKRRPQGRTPLWLQRKKSQDLQAAAQRFERFPIILETYRECLQDVFDVPALKTLLNGLRDRSVTLHEVETHNASPFARSLVFQYIAAYLYDGDAPLAERKAQALSLDRELLRELLGQEELRELLDAGAVDAVELELQRLTPERAVRHVDALHDLLRRLGDLTDDEVAARCDGDAAAWLATLEQDRRVLRVTIHGTSRWIAIEDAARVRDALGTSLPSGIPRALLEPVDNALPSLLLRWVASHGPFHTEQLADRYGLPASVVELVLRHAEREGRVVQGEMRPGGTRREWCDADVLRRLRRRSLAVLRQQVEPVEPVVYARFLPAWHGLDTPGTGLNALRQAIEQLEGLALPWSALETEILPARVQGYHPDLLDTLGAMGEVAWVGRAPLGARDGRVSLVFRDRIDLFLSPPSAEAPDLSPLQEALRHRLETGGACFLAELHGVTLDDGAPIKTAALQEALWDLVWMGLVSNDTFAPLRALSAPQKRRTTHRRRAFGAKGRGRLATGGRWSLLQRLNVATPTEEQLARVDVLLERYGIVSREAAQTEGVPGGFSAIYPVLRTMEEGGQARRGYFIEEMGGAQFALGGAVDRLRGFRDPDEPVVRVLATLDPALAWGGILAWPETFDPEHRPRRVTGSRVVTYDGHPVFWLSSSGSTLLTFRRALDAEVMLTAAVSALRTRIGYRSLRIDKIDGQPAGQHPCLKALLHAGFERDGAGIALRR